MNLDLSGSRKHVFILALFIAVIQAIPQEEYWGLKARMGLYTAIIILSLLLLTKQKVVEARK